MKYKAIVFDLGGTLVRSASWSEYADAARKMASILTAPIEDFVELWFDQSSGLGTGEFQSYQDYIRHVCKQLSLDLQDSKVQAAASIPFEMTKRMVMVPQEGAIELLSFLKSNGYKTGLISDCATDVPTIWNDTLFAPLIDVAIFSCSVGMNKADPRIFELAINELGVEPERCLYIADGMRQELANASKIGMSALKIRVPTEINDSPLRERWNGAAISSLIEVIDLLE